MSDFKDEIGLLNLSGFRPDEIGLKQIYSPSRLYSVIIPEETDLRKVLCLQNVFFLNNATKMVKKYTIQMSKTSKADLKVNYLYWLADFLLVGVIQQKRGIKQILFTVDHVAKSIVKEKERKFLVMSEVLIDRRPAMFASHKPVIYLQGRDYIAWAGEYNIDGEHYCMFLIPRNPLGNDSIKQFWLKQGLSGPILDEISSFLPEGNNGIDLIGIPSFSTGSQLLCRLEQCVSNTVYLNLFGICLTYDFNRLVDVYGKDDYNVLDLDSQQESAISLTVLPKPPSMAAQNFYSFKNNVGRMAESYCLTYEDTGKRRCELRLINFNTMEYQSKILKKPRFARFFLHPDGFVIFWNKTSDKIEYKKVMFSWKSDSLFNIMKKSLILSTTINPLEVNGLQPILFPGSETISNPKPKSASCRNFFSSTIARLFSSRRFR